MMPTDQCPPLRTAMLRLYWRATFTAADTSLPSAAATWHEYNWVPGNFKPVH